MLQQRLPLRCLRSSCVRFPSIVPRSYATVVDKAPGTPESSPKVDSAFTPPPVREKEGLAVRRYKPRTPGVRHLRRPINDHLWKGRPIRSLTFPKKGQGKGGRNNTGRVTVRHRGGGHKRRIRVIDFKRTAPGPHTVERIEHDPNRSAHIALLRSQKTKKYSYIIAAEGMRAGDVVESYMSGIPEELWKSMGGTIDPGVLAAKTAWRGNCLPLHMVPIGTLVYNIGLHRKQGGQLCRSAGTYGVVIAKAGDSVEEIEAKLKQVKEENKARGEAEKKLSRKKRKKLEAAEAAGEKKEEPILSQADRLKFERLANHVTVRLSSGEVRLLHKDCCATIGVASNVNFHYRQLGKAGRSRWLGIRPTVRGVAMNAMDHPHGGGRGKSKGNVDPKSPWGIPTKSGYRTRPKWRVNKAVVVPRPRNQGKRRRGYN